jgi:hypothetical protein
MQIVHANLRSVPEGELVRQDPEVSNGASLLLDSATFLDAIEFCWSSS